MRKRLELVLGEAVGDPAADGPSDGEPDRPEDEAADGARSAGDEAALEGLLHGHSDVLLVGERGDHVDDVIVPDDHLGGREILKEILDYRASRII